MKCRSVKRPHLIDRLGTRPFVLSACLVLLAASTAAGQGIITTVAGSTWRFTSDNVPATSAPLGQVRRLTVDSDGNVFVADQDNHVVVKITPGGTLYLVAGNGIQGFSGDGGQATAAQLNSPHAVAVDASGNLYISDFGNGRIRKVNSTTGVIETFAGTGSAGFNGDGLAATVAWLNAPEGLALDAEGNLYIADTNNHRIRRVSAASGIISTYAGNGTGTYSGEGAATAASLNHPSGIRFDAAGNLYIADTDNFRIRKVAPGNPPAISTVFEGSASQNHFFSDVAVDSNGLVYYNAPNWCRVRRIALNGFHNDVAGTMSSCGFSGDGGQATAASLNYPYGFALDGSDNIYIADTGNRRVRKILSATGIISTIGGNGLYKFAGDGGPATLAALNLPAGVALAGSGNIYIADSNNARIRKRDVSGNITTVAGKGTTAFSGDNGPATAAGIGVLGGVAVGPDGLYIADCQNQRIRKISTGGTITTFAGTGTYGTAGDNGPATQVQLANPSSLAFDSAGNLYVTDQSHRVRRITPTGTITTVAGTGTPGFSADGVPATQASLNYPEGLAVDPNGYIYVADTYNRRVRKFQPGGTIVTVAGNGQEGVSGDGGQATAARLSLPVGVAVDGSGNIYIADPQNNSVRTVNSSGVIIRVAGQSGGLAGYSGDGGPAADAKLQMPYGVAVDSAGNVYIADFRNDRVRMVTPGGSGGGLTIVSGDNQSAPVTTTLPAPLVVRAFSGFSGVTVNFSVTSGSATLSASSVVTDLNGQAQVNVTLGTVAGIVTISATASGVTTPVVFTATALGGSPVSVTIVSGNNQAAPLGTALANPLVVKVADQYGNSVSGAAVNFSVSSGGGTLSATSVTTGTNGQAQVTWTMPAVTGTYILTATCGSAAPVNMTAVSAAPLATSIITTVAGGGPATFEGDGGPATNATLRRLKGIAIDRDGNLFVADALSSIVVRVAPGGLLTVVAGNGTVGYSGDGGAATAASLDYLGGLAVDSAGNLYIATRGSPSRIRKVDTAGRISTWAGGQMSYGGYGDGGPATLAYLSNPENLAFDSAGNLYIADTYNGRVRRVTPGGIITTVAGGGTGGDGGLATAASLNLPYAVAFNQAGELHIGEDHRVRRVNASGIISTVAGQANSGFGGDGGLATAALLSGISGLAFDSAGNLYIVDGNNSRVRRVTADNFIRTIAGNGTISFAGDGGAATAASLNFPTGLVIDSAGALYIADGQNSRVRKVSPDGVIVTVAGNGQWGVPVDGIPATQSLISPGGVAVDAVGNLYIADTGHNKIRKVGAGGIITTVAGNGAAGFSGDGGPATAASLNYPCGVAVDGAGNLYISDSDNHRIRKVGTDGNISTIAGKQVLQPYFFGDGGPATNAVLNSPHGIVIDGAGNLYFTDGSGRIRKIGIDGIITSVAGGGSLAASDGLYALYAMIDPHAIAVDISGNLYISEGRTYNVLKVGIDGLITKIATCPLCSGYADMQGVAVDLNGSVYFGIGIHPYVYKTSGGQGLATVAGTGFEGFSGDGGPATAAMLSAAGAMTVDSAGNLFIADGSRVRKVSAPSGGPVAGSIIIVSGNNQTLPPHTDASPLVVQVNDTGGNPLPGVGVDFALTSGNSIYSLPIPTIVVTGPDGRASLAVKSSGGVGVGKVTASVPKTGLQVVFSLTVPPGPPSQLYKVSPTEYQQVAGTTLPAVVEVRDNNGDRVPGVTVTFEVTAGGGSVSPASAVSDAAGQAQVNWTLGTTPGTNKLRAFSGSLAPVEFTVPGMAGSPTMTIVLGDRQTGIAGRPLPIPLVLLLTDWGGVPMAGVPVYFYDSGNQLLGSVSTDADGLAVAVVTLGSAVGPVIIQAVASGGTLSATFRLTSVPAAAASLTAVSGNSQAAPAGAMLPAPLVVRVTDQYGNRVPGVTVAFTVTSGGGSVSPATAVTGAQGEAQVRWTLGPAAGTNTTTATVGSLTPVVFTVQASKLPPGGTIATIAGGGPFPASASAANAPLGFVPAVAFDSSGNAYASDATNQVVIKISPAGTATVVAGNGTRGYSGDGGPATQASLNGPWGLAVDAAGILLIADSENSCIRRVGLNGVITTIVGQGNGGYWGDGGPATAAGLNGPRGIALDAGGNLYIADSANQMVRKVAASDGTITTVAGASTLPGYSVGIGPAWALNLHSPSAVAVDTSGNLYLADSDNQRVVKVGPTGTVVWAAGNGGSGSGGDGGPATAATFFRPLGVAVAGTGNVYVADTYNNKIRKISAAGVITTLAGNDTAGGFFGDGLAARYALLSAPYGVAVDSSGTVLVADAWNGRVRRIDTSGIINTLAGGRPAKFFGDEGSATSGRLSAPAGLTIDSSGNIYVADKQNRRIRRVAANGTITTFAGNGEAVAAGDGGPATSASFYAPSKVALDSGGNLYVIDGARIRKIAASGAISTIAGSNVLGFGGDGGPATNAQFYNPNALAINAAGEIFIADTTNNRIRKIATDGRIATVAGNGNSIFSGDGGQATAASVPAPVGIAVDSSGSLYIVSDLRLRRVTSDGIIRTIAGTGSSAFSGDGGPATAASFVQPTAVLVDARGNIFISEGNTESASVGNSQRIRQILPNGIINTVAGTGAAAFAGDGGPAVLASLNGPAALAMDSAGALYVADRDNDRVRKLTPGVLGAVSGDNQSGPLSGALAVPLVVQVNDAAGAPSPGVPVYFTVLSGSATLSAALATSDGNGRASMAATMGSQAGTVTIRASVNAFVTPLTFTATAVAGPPPSISIASGNNQTGVVGGNLPQPLVVSAVDTASRPIAGLVVSFAVSSAPAGATGATVTSSCTTDSSGQCQAILNMGSVAGAYTVTASANDSGGNPLANSPLQFQASAIVGRYYLVGDVFPTPSAAGDLNLDGDYYDAGEFGDGSLTILDLIYALRAVTSVPGHRPPTCSDRFDAIDSFPKDTDSTRGGDGILNTVDLIMTLRRVTNVDTARPQRLQRTGLCGSQAPGSPATMAARAGGNEAGISGEFGAGIAVGHSLVRVPLFFQFTGESNLAGLSLAVGMSDGQAGARLRFVPADGVPAPSLIDDQLPGVLALAWLDGLRLPDSRRVLLGYVEVPAVPAGVSLRFYGASANTSDGSELRLTLPAPSSSFRPR